MADALVIRGSIVIPAEELEWKAARSSGPGGQNVNRVATKVELRFDLAGTRVLDAATRARLRRSAKARLDADGRLVITSQSTRSQAQNLEIAREKLAELIRAALVAPKRRKATRPTRASKERRLNAKRKTSDKKQTRRRVRDD